MLQSSMAKARLWATYGLGFALISTQSGCALKQMIKMAKDQELTVNPSPLELHGDSVKFQMSAKLPVKMLKKDKTYTVETFYKYKDQSLSVGKVLFKSSEFPKAKTEQPLLTKTFGFAYKGGEMDRGTLSIIGTAANLNNRKKSTPEMPLGVKGIIMTNKLVQEVFIPAFAGHGYVPGEELEPTNIQFFFDQGSSKLRVEETKSTRGQFLDNFIAAKNPTKTVVITGMHSPEGREIRNTSLSEERAKAIEDYYKAQMKRFDLSQMPAPKGKKGKKGKATPAPAPVAPAGPQIDFVTKSIVQNWDILKDTIKVVTTLTQEQKDEIIKTINNSKGTFEETELELQKLPTYATLLTDVYPRLRSAQTEILTVIPKKDEATIKTLASGIAGGTEDAKKLTDKELAYAATLTPILEEREAIYKAATRKNDSWASHNNLGATYLQMAARASNNADRRKYADVAITHLEISKRKQNSAEANVNLAIAYLMKDDRNGAALMLAAAGAATPSQEASKVIKAMNGVVFIKAGNYPAAISAMNNAVIDPVVAFNRGLAYLLSKNYDAALTAFTEATTGNPNYAPAYYGAAIAFARKKEEAGLVRNLSKAVQLDAKLKERAVTDLEFDAFREREAVRNALK